MQGMAESSYKRLTGKPRDSGGQQQESTSTSFDVDKIPNLDRATVPYDDFGWVSEATPDWVKEHSAIFVDTDQVSLAALQARHCHCIFNSRCLIDRWTEGLRVPRQPELRSTKGILLCCSRISTVRTQLSDGEKLDVNCIAGNSS